MEVSRQGRLMARLRVAKVFCGREAVRVPLIVKWPSDIQAGSRSNIPVSSVDFYPTVLKIAGLMDEG